MDAGTKMILLVSYLHNSASDLESCEVVSLFVIVNLLSEKSSLQLQGDTTSKFIEQILSSLAEHVTKF